jgi:hypothetical protein
MILVWYNKIKIKLQDGMNLFKNILMLLNILILKNLNIQWLQCIIKILLMKEIKC